MIWLYWNGGHDRSFPDSERADQKPVADEQQDASTARRTASPGWRGKSLDRPPVATAWAHSRRKAANVTPNVTCGDASRSAQSLTRASVPEKTANATRVKMTPRLLFKPDAVP